MSYLPNPLNEYSTYSYNIALYMTNPEGSVSTGNSNEKILIANNATTPEFNIQSMEQINVVGNDIVRETFVNKFDIVLTEPNGSTFFNKLVDTAIKLGIPNHLQAEYIIELTFPARDKNNRPVVYQPKFYYPIKFMSVVANISETGSIYNISAYEVSSTAYSYLNGVMPSTITFTGKTVGEVITAMENALNDASRINWYNDFNSVYHNTYRIEFAEDTEEWSKWPIESLDDTLQTNLVSIDGDKLIFHLQSGTNISEYIGIILSSTNEFKKIPTYPNGYKRENASEPSTSGSDKIPYTFKVIANVKNEKYDILRQDYSKQITYKIKRHLATGLIVDPGEYNKTISEESIQSRKIKNLKDAGMLRKRYDYLFTGKNTEVLALDLKLEMAYYQLTPLAGGQIYHPRQVETEGKNGINVRDKIKSLKGKIVTTNRQLLEQPENFSLLDLRLEYYKNEFLGETGKLDEEAIKNNILNSKSPIVSFHSDRQDNKTTSGPTTDFKGTSEMLFGSVVANIENPSDLLEIEINIKGDPYWLGKPNSFYTQGNETEELADYELGGNMFFLKVNLPTPESNTGRRIPSPDYTISGIYRVINVINQYRDGLFTQYLKAYRDNNILTEKVLSSIDTNE